MKKAFRFIAALLCALVPVGLCVGCGKAAPPPTPLTYAQLLSDVKQTSQSRLDEHIRPVTSWGMADGMVWAFGQYTDPETGQSSSPRLAISTVSGLVRSCTEWQLPAPQLQPEQGQKHRQTAVDMTLNADGTVYLLVEERVFATEKDGSYTVTDQLSPTAQRLDICVVGETGEVLPLTALQLPSANQYEPAFSLEVNAGQFLCAGDGNIWIGFTQYPCDDPDLIQKAQGLLCRFAQDGSCTGSWPMGDFATGLIPLTEDRLAATWGLMEPGAMLLSDTDMDSPALAPLDLGAALAFGAQPVITAEPQQEQLFFWNADGVHCYALADGTVQPVLAWKDYLVESAQIRTVLMPDADRVVVITQPAFGQPYTFTVLKPGAPNPLAGRETVSVGVHGMSADLVRQAAEAYNFTDPAVYVRVVDYSNEAAAKASFDSGGAMMDRHILAGEAPDLLMTGNGTNTRGLIQKGLFIDLAPWLDADPQLSREDLLPGVLHACEQGGALPTVVPCFLLYTTAGDSDVVGQQMGWTLQEFAALCDSYPDATPIYAVDRNSALLDLMRYSGDYIDYENATAHFDTPQFIRLLELCARQPAQYADINGVDPKPTFDARQALLQNVWVFHFRSQLALQYDFDGSITYKGYPSAQGNGAVIAPEIEIGITSSCQKPEAAWAFLRTLLLPEFQRQVWQSTRLNRCFPLRADALQEAAADALKELEPQAPITYPTTCCSP